jgi:hypothetical protein
MPVAGHADHRQPEGIEGSAGGAASPIIGQQPSGLTFRSGTNRSELTAANGASATSSLQRDLPRSAGERRYGA